MAIDVRQIGGIKANDSSDSALIAALDSRYGNSLSGGGAAVLPTFNSTNTIVFGSPGVSIIPASTGSSTYNVQLGLPANLEAVTSGGGSGFVTVATTLEHGSVGGSDVSTLWGIYPRPDSSNSNKYLLDLTLPTNALLAGGGSNPTTVGVSLSNGTIVGSDNTHHDEWGVKVRPSETAANTYYLDLHLPSNASVAGTGSGDLSFTSADAVYTLSSASANQAKVSISGSGTSYTTKLILPASASQSGGGTLSKYVTSIAVGKKDRYASEFDIRFTPYPTTGAMDYTCDISLPGASVASGATPTNIATELDWNDITMTLDSVTGMVLKKNTKYGFSCPKIQASYNLGNGNTVSAPCYGIWLKTKGISVGDSDSGEINGNTYSGKDLQACRDAGIGFFLVDGTNAQNLIGACEFRVAYSFVNDDKLHSFKLFDLYDHDLTGYSNTGRNVSFTPWVDAGTMNVQTFANGLAGYGVADEGFLPLTVNLTDARYPGANVAKNSDSDNWHFTSSGTGYTANDQSNLYYYLLMMKRKDINNVGKTAYGGFGINSNGHPIFLTCVVDSSTGKAKMSAGKIAVEAYTDILGSK